MSRGGVFERHRRRIEREDANMPEEIRAAMSPRASTRRATMRVRDYNTGLTLPGRPDAALIAESLAESSGTGAVPACCEDGVWKYIEPSRVDSYRQRGEQVKVVFVEEV